jgi:hypothetical protein
MFFSISVAQAIEVDGSTITVFGNIFIQGGTAKGDEDAGTISANDGLFAGGVIFGREFSNGGRALIKIRAGSGDNSIGSNDAVQNTKANIILSTIWYAQPLVNDSVEIKLGRIGTIGGDSVVTGNPDFQPYTQFIHPLFTGEVSEWDPYVEDNGDAWGISFDFSPTEIIDITYGYAGPTGKGNDTTETIYTEGFGYTTNLGSFPVYMPMQNTISGKTYHIDSDGFNALEINFKFIEDGNYRIKYWKLNEYKTDGNDTPQGIAMSFDQKLYYFLTVGFRYGQVLSTKSLPYTVKDNLSIKSSYSLAARLTGELWNRVEDCLAAAVGEEIYNIETSKSSSALICEIYYKYAINDYISISPSIQYQAYSNLDWLKNQIAYVVRTHINF